MLAPIECCVCVHIGNSCIQFQGSQVVNSLLCDSVHMDQKLMSSMMVVCNITPYLILSNHKERKSKKIRFSGIFPGCVPGYS